jgi:hypothetical protein
MSSYIIIYFFRNETIFLYLYRYENGWKALMAYTDGVILVYNPDSPGLYISIFM